MRFILTAVFLLAGVGIASASSHGAMPYGASFADLVVWELQHFALHLTLTLQAIQVMFVSPALGWAMLGDQAMCAGLGFVTAFLFKSAPLALLTFMVSVAAAAFAVLALVLRVKTLVHERRLHVLVRAA